ncbi:hypothetical protein BDY21DRAFT_290737 [Lineolata rhizophorae]|uniref:Uncharacterized protein n=1 Tax=Lineolata rhizophorae TaxID=578093 RepID=A0A6A6NSF9_9PEZI|nr:hypothetical protein BDY21DRAFT_290737 [Lineolata rhizophorae]
MQVHAVPESERAFDPSSGRQLPWGYQYADSDLNQRPAPEEKGPFGKSRRRNISRSKTVTPARKEDQARLDNIRAVDDIFTALKTDARAQEKSRERSTGLQNTAHTLQQAAGSATTGQISKANEPTEVMLYGFGSDVQYAAIDYYERVSGGIIYEDYDRHPPHSKYNSTLSLSRLANQGSLSQAALRKKNQYVGGDHWIKITFDSAEAADRACHYSPRAIHGYTVYAERYRGVGPNADVAIPASQRGLPSQTASPSHQSSSTLPATTTLSPSSDTASSATAAGAPQHGAAGDGQLRNRQNTAAAPQGNEPAAAGARGEEERREARPLRIAGAKRAVLLPAEEALLPVGSRWQRTLGNWPVLSWLFGSGRDIIGNQVPRKEDGQFDWDNASFYWQFWAWIDSVLGTNICGLKVEE